MGVDMLAFWAAIAGILIGAIAMFLFISYKIGKAVQEFAWRR